MILLFLHYIIFAIFRLEIPQIDLSLFDGFCNTQNTTINLWNLNRIPAITTTGENKPDTIREEVTLEDLFEDFVSHSPQEEETLIINNRYNWLPIFTDEDISRPSYSQNVWRDTNNPWNIMNWLWIWAIWVYKSKNWRYYSIFENVEDWYQAMISEVEKIKEKAKKNWKKLLLSSFLSAWIFWQWWNIDKTSYYWAQALGIAWWDKTIDQLDTETIGKIIMIWEATRESYLAGWKDLSHLSTIYIDLSEKIK